MKWDIIIRQISHRIGYHVSNEFIRAPQRKFSDRSNHSSYGTDYSIIRYTPAGFRTLPTPQPQQQHKSRSTDQSAK
jgi:hypothetical protein